MVVCSTLPASGGASGARIFIRAYGTRHLLNPVSQHRSTLHHAVLPAIHPSIPHPTLTRPPQPAQARPSMSKQNQPKRNETKPTQNHNKTPSPFASPLLPHHVDPMMSSRNPQ